MTFRRLRPVVLAAAVASAVVFPAEVLAIVRPGAPAVADDGAWHRIHGTVHAVEGTRLTLEADDGRVLQVDMTDVSEAVRKTLAPYEGVTVVGRYTDDGRTVIARYIQQDSSVPAAAPRSGR
jgi:hypothetical protein